MEDLLQFALMDISIEDIVLNAEEGEILMNISIDDIEKFTKNTTNIEESFLTRVILQHEYEIGELFSPNDSFSIESSNTEEPVWTYKILNYEVGIDGVLNPIDNLSVPVQQIIPAEPMIPAATNFCVQCNKQFRTSGSFLQHNNTHHSGRTFKCEKCGKVFKTQSILEKHEQNCCGSAL